MHLIFKIATTLFILVWVVGIGLEVFQTWQVLGPMQVGGEVLLDPLGEPWRTWFKDQTNMILAPTITISILLLLTYLSKRNRRGTT